MLTSASTDSEIEPTAVDVRAQLERVVKSELFAQTERLRRLLAHVVEETLEGHPERLLGKNIVADVFSEGRRAAADDVSTVRVEFGRLRRRLVEFYTTEGAADAIRIDIPKGAYTATFEYRWPEGEPVASGKPERSRWRVAAFAVGGFAILLAAVVVYWRLSGGESEVARVRQPLVAVVPLQNLSGDGDDWLALGLTTDIVNRLVKFDHILLVSRNLTGRMTGAQSDVGEIGAKTNADYVLTGSIRRDYQVLQINLELIRVSDGVIVWSDADEYPADVKNFIAAQTGIADRIVGEIAGYTGVVVRAELQASELAAAPDHTAYFCALRLYAYRQNQSAAEHAAVRQCLEYAVEEAPDFAAAWSGLAYIYLDEIRNDFNPRPGEYDPLEKARAAAERAIELAPGSAAAHRAKAAVLFTNHEIDAVVKTAERGIALNPNDVDLLSYYGHMLTISGNWETGRELMEQAIAMNPVHPTNWHFSLALDEYRQKKFKAALDEALKIRMPQFYMTHVFQAAIHGQLGNDAEAEQAVASLEKTRPGYGAVAQKDLLLRNIPESVVELLLDGLGKAGLEGS